MKELQFERNGANISISAKPSEGGWRLSLPDGSEYEIAVRSVNGAAAALTAMQVGPDGSRGPERFVSVPAVRSGRSIAFSWKGRVYRFLPADRVRAQATGAADTGSVTAPTGGVIADVLVVEGQAVEANEQIAVIEAMKVMTPVETGRAGVVSKLMVTRGQRIEQGGEIARIEAGVAKKSEEGRL